MYYLISGKYEIEDKKYTGYGIGYENTKIEDISTDKEKICELIEKMNKENYVVMAGILTQLLNCTKSL